MKRPVVYQHARFDGPIRLGSDESLLNTEVIKGGALFGNILFTEDSPMVCADGRNITISGCFFWNMNQEPTWVFGGRTRLQRWWNERMWRRWESRMTAIQLPEGTRYRLAE